MYKFIFLDLDDTLLDFGKAEDAAIGKTFRELGIVPTEALVALYKRINEGQWERFERGQISREEVLISRFDILFARCQIALSGAYCESVYARYLAQGHYFIDGAEALLDYLKKCGYLLYIASNGVAATQDSRLDSAGIRPYFQNIFISETTGHHKPEKAYFDYCFAQIPDFEKARALLIGDSLTSDIQGGKNAGIDTCWFNPKRKPLRLGLAPRYEIHSLQELRDIL